ncbi:MAG: HD-GYP domain-containing protein [Acidimicrobiales bacterium]
MTARREEVLKHVLVGKDAPDGGTNERNEDLARPIVDYCEELLESAIRSVAAAVGVIFAVENPNHLSLPTHLSLVVDHGAVTHGLQLLERAGRLALEAGRPVLTGAPGVPSDSRRRTAPTGYLSMPVRLDGDAVAVIVLAELESCELSLEACSARLVPILLPVALSVDRLRIQAALEERGGEIAALRQQLDAYAVDFRSTYLAERDRSQQLAEALSELEKTYKATVQGLAVAVEAKDECTGGHLQRVSCYGMMLTAVVAPDHASDPQFEYGFLLHDIGKLTIPDIVLTKAGPLTESEWVLIREHPESGRRILDGIPFLAGAREIIHAHHEHWDGSGYPLGLKGDEIPLGAKIFPLCDAFDAMTSERPYRSASSIEEARSEVRRCRGTQFWHEAVDAFLSLPTEDLASIRADSQGGAP